MAGLSSEELAKIVAEQMPGYVLDPETIDVDAAPSNKAAPEAVTPNLKSLREKYLGDLGAQAAQPSNTGTAEESTTTSEGAGESLPQSDAEAEDTMVIVHTKTTPGTEFEATTGPKAVLVSGATKEIIAVQG